METQIHHTADDSLSALYDLLESKHPAHVGRKNNKRIQFDAERLYITPFTQQRVLGSPKGDEVYIPQERTLKPTGIWVIDDCLRAFAKGQDPTDGMLERYGLTPKMCRPYSTP